MFCLVYVRVPVEVRKGHQGTTVRMIMSHQVDAENGTWVLCKSNKYNKLWSHLSTTPTLQPF